MTTDGERLALEQAIAQRQRELEHHRRSGDRWHQATTLHELGGLYQQLGQPGQALTSYEQALTIFQQLGDSQGEVATLHNLGVLLRDEDPERARAAYEQALTILRHHNDRRGQAFTLHNLGQLYESLGRDEQAKAAYQEAIAILQALGEPSNEAVPFINLGRLAERRERYDEARQHYQQARQLLQQAGALQRELIVIKDLGRLAERQEHYKEARRLYEEACVLCRRLGYREGEVGFLLSLAGVYHQSGQLLQARATYEQALTLQAGSQNDPLGLFAIHIDLGGLLFQLALTGSARHHYEQALTLARSNDLPPSCEYMSWNALGQFFHYLGQPVQAIDRYRRAFLGRARSGDTTGLILTLRSISDLYGHFGQLESALAHLLEARTIAEEQGDSTTCASIDDEIASIRDQLGPEALAFIRQISESERSLLIEATIAGIIPPELSQQERLILPPEQLSPLIERISLALADQSPPQERQALQSELEHLRAQAQAQSAPDEAEQRARAAAADFYAALLALLEGEPAELPPEHPYALPLFLIQKGQTVWRAFQIASNQQD